MVWIPAVNWAPIVCLIGIMLVFGNSSNLASAYAIAARPLLWPTNPAPATHRWKQYLGSRPISPRHQRIYCGKVSPA